MLPASGSHFGGVTWPRHAGVLALHLSIGPDLFLLRVDRDDFSLREVGRLTLPAPIQYAVAHPMRSLMYVVASNRSISPADDLHTLSTVAVDERTGAMCELARVPLPTRPIHLTATPAGDGLLVAYNAPALVTAHAIDNDGLAGPPLAQLHPPSVGIFPHQVRLLPSGQAAVVVARGNHAGASRAEDPGSLEFLSLQGGSLAHLGTVAPRGGFGFGPRHLEFHPGGRWAAVSLERQNELQVFEVQSTRFAEAPAWSLSTLEGPNDSGHDQLSGTLRFHPRGDRLYVVNRHDPHVYGDGSVPARLAGNGIAVFAFDATSGRCEAVQHAPTESVHVRTMSLDEDARVLVAASILPAMAVRDGVATHVPARLTFFRVDGDGGLTPARVQDMPNDRYSMFWSTLNGRA